MKVDPRFKDTEFCIEADGYARMQLWSTWSTQSMFKHPDYNYIRWEDDGRGTMPTIGELAGMPITVCFLWAKLNDHLVVFYNATSQVVDHRMVEAYLDKYCNPQHNSRQARCDANNFHSVISYIKDCETDAILKEAKLHADNKNFVGASLALEDYWRKHPYSTKEYDRLNKLVKANLKR